jgi:hypothetical protein
MMTLRRDPLRLARLPFAIGFAGGLALSIPVAADPAALPGRGVGSTFEILQVGTTVYRHVQVRSVNARTVIITCDGGLISIRLRDLSPELQAEFGYDPAAEAAAEKALAATEPEAGQKRAKDAPAKSTAGQGAVHGSDFDLLLQSFGQPPEIRPGVDLRPQFHELALNVKNQGPRPSCAVFAIVSALEFQNARLTGQAERFSEEYLLWATRKTLNRLPRARPEADPSGDDAENSESLDSADEGFALSEVVTALRAYGVPLQSTVPYTFAGKNAAADPPPQVIDEARRHRRVSVVALPGRDQAARIANLMQALNAGIPVAIGVKWPPWRTLRTGYLSGQKPLDQGGHAICIVGYENKTGSLADTVFIFKNSWGVNWGAGGYGFVTYRYLDHNLGETALLDVELPEAPPNHG